jgi:ATP-dependent Zn protease
MDLNFDLKNILGNKKTAGKKTGRALDYFKLIRYIYPLTIVVILIFIYLLMSFLYNNVYLTMTQAAIVGSLKAKVIEERLSIENFNDIAAKLEAKKTIGKWTNNSQITSPFDYGSRIKLPATTTPTTTTATSTNAATSTIIKK